MTAFAVIEPGNSLGESAFLLTLAEVAEWTSLFPSDAASLPTMPRGMIAMVTMRAFMEILHDRPKGNIHAAQRFLVWKLPSVGDQLITQLRCVEKTLKSERRWITFETNTSTAQGTPLFQGQMKMLWAA